jgi:hypothetical protein
MPKSKARDLASLLSGSGTGTIAPALVSDQQNTSTGHFDVPAGTTAERPANPNVGHVRFNTDLDQLEQYTDDSGWQGISPPPTITTTDVTTVQETDSTQTVVITGQNFDTSATGVLVDANGVTKSPTTSTRNSSSQITITYSGGDVLTNSVAEPLDVKVVNGSGLSAVLDSQININAAPIWTTTAGSLGIIVEDEAMTNISLAATDADGDSVSFALASGSSLPSGLSLSSSGVISGTPNVNDAYSTGVTHNFSVNAADGSTTNTRAFSILRKWRDGSTSSLAASTADAIKQLTGTTTPTDYWINVNGTPRLIFCDMNGTYTNGSGNADTSKGYMLLMAFGNNNSILNNALAHTSTFYWADPNGGSASTAASAVGLTTNANYGAPGADYQTHYIGSNPIGYLAQSRSSFNSDTAGFTISRINIKGGHPYDNGGVRQYINEVEISPILSANNGTYTWEANNGSSSTWAWYMNESSSTPSISSIYHVFVR